MSNEKAQFITTECKDCGDELEIMQPKCGDCSAPIPDHSELDLTPVIEVPELEALIDKWRPGLEEMTTDPYWQARQECADDLEELIEPENPHVPDDYKERVQDDE